MNKNKTMEFLSSLGRSLMMPIATLAAAGIFLGLTSALTKPQILEVLPFLEAEYIFYGINTLRSVSAVVFSLIPVLFAISIALGMAKEDKEIAAFAAFVGYYTFLLSASVMVNSGFISVENLRIANILGVETIDMGAVSGIAVGLIVAYLHNKYKDIEFPVAIAFYGGKRFVTIIVIIVTALVGQIAPIIWMPISAGINSLGTVISNLGAVGVFIFGMLERLLIPTGLHHILNGVFRTTPIGGVYEGVEGALNIFLQFIDQVDMAELAPYTQYLAQGKFPFMLFGLPAAAYAIYQTTPNDKKDAVKALLIAGVAATFVSGITEPVEFAFMFIAPVLFVFHAVMAGLSFMLMSILGVVIGNTGGGLIDFVIWGILQPGSRWYYVLLVGIPYALIYYGVFKWYLQKKEISIDVSEETADEIYVPKGDGTELGLLVIEGLGGLQNITSVNNCISRLRVDLKDMGLVNENLLKKSGSMGILKQSETHIHIVYGPKVESVAKQVKEIYNY